MKYQIRQGVFETNSSSVHSLSICSKNEWEAFERGEMMYSFRTEQFLPTEDALAYNKEEENRYKNHGWNCEWDDLYLDRNDYDRWFETHYYEQFRNTKNVEGVDVVVFGYYGSDY